MWAELAGGALGIAGGLIENKANAQEAQKNRDFQERMANSAHQREVADLKAAGLNPMLSGMGGSGAATPSGSTAQMGDALGKGLNSALQVKQMKQAMEAQESQIALNDAAKEAKIAEKSLNASNAAKSQEEALLVMSKYREQEIANSMAAAQLPAVQAQAVLDTKNAKFGIRSNDVDNYMKRAREGLGLVNDAVGVVKPKININTGYDETHINPGTGEIYKERQVRYKR